MRYLEEEQARSNYTGNMTALEKMVRLNKELKKENSRRFLTCSEREIFPDSEKNLTAVGRDWIFPSAGTMIPP